VNPIKRKKVLTPFIQSTESQVDSINRKKVLTPSLNSTVLKLFTVRHPKSTMSQILERRKATITTCKQQITRNVNLIAKTSQEIEPLELKVKQGTASIDDLANLKIMLKTLGSQCKKLEQYDEEWISQLTNENQVDYDKHINENDHVSIKDEAEDKVTIMLETLEDFKQSMQSKSSPTVNKGALQELVKITQQLAISQRSSQTLQLARLSPIELPTFNGEHDKWRSFKDKFIALIDGQNIADVQKLCYLLQSVNGQAKDLIGEIEVTNGNYSIAWDLLKNR